MSNLLSLNYWFDMRPAAMAGIAQKSLLAFCVLLGIGIISFYIVSKNNKGGIYNKIYKKLGSFSSTNLIIGLFMIFFTYELIPFLSSRFWFLLWAVEMGVWLYFIGTNLSQIPGRIEELKKEKELKKYIP